METNVNTQESLVPSDKQIAFLKRYGFDGKDIVLHSRKECAAKIDEIIRAQRAARREPPTEAQLRFLEDAGYNRLETAKRTKGWCSSLIYKIKSGKAS